MVQMLGGQAMALSPPFQRISNEKLPSGPGRFPLGGMDVRRTHNQITQGVRKKSPVVGPRRGGAR